MQEAIDSKSIIIASSNLTDEDKAILKSLCARTFAGDVTLKTTEAINKKTTLCIVPAETNTGDNTDKDNIRACARTLKVMRSALAGIPIVTPDWLRSCEKENKAVEPVTFVRSMPTKEAVIGNSRDTDYGVAKMAASWSTQPKTPVLPFRKTVVYLCGSYSADKRKNLQDLLKAGGAKIILKPKDVSSRLKSLVESNKLSFFPSSGRLVILCGDSGVTMPKSVEKDLKAALEGEQHWPEPKSPKTVTVVGSQWVIESVTCAKPMPAAFFEPKINKDLWKLSL